ncbi:MAG: hypothetical protein R3F61_07475 [Myxococcota bacterium]
MSALLAMIVLSGCAPSVPDGGPRTPVLIATFEDRAAGFDTLAEEGVRFDNAWAHAAPLRPALASLLTGLTPEQHGLTDPVLHGLTAPTLGDELAAAGWQTFRDLASPSPLHPRESWGFAEPGVGTGPGTLTWVHGPDAVDTATRWLRDNPEGIAFVTGLPNDTPVTEGGGHVPLAWFGPDSPPGEVRTELAAHVDVAATITALLELEPLGSGVPLPEGGSEQVVLLESLPRLTVGGPVTRVVRTEGAVQLTPTELPPITDLVPIDPIATWTEDSLPTDPLASTPTDNSREALQPLREAQAALKNNRLRDARQALERSDERAGPTPTGDLLRVELLQREGRPREALDLLEARWDRSPSDALAFRIGITALELREPTRAARWLDRVLDRRPDHPLALASRIRCAALSGDPDLVDGLHAHLWVVDAAAAGRVQVQLDLDAGRPPDLGLLARLESASDPEARLLLARAIWQRGHWREALDRANAILGDHPRHVDTRLALATWSIELGDAEQAVRLVGPVARWFPDDLRVGALDSLARDALATERWQLQAIRGGFRGHP